MTVTMYGWLSVGVVAVVVLLWWLNRGSGDAARAQAAWCYDIALLGYEKARALRVGQSCGCAVPVESVDYDLRVCCNECGCDLDSVAASVPCEGEAVWPSCSRCGAPARGSRARWCWKCSKSL